MPEFRQNMVSKEWVIVAPERAKRPEDFVKQKKERKVIPERVENCPFCTGNEGMTPPPVYLVERNGNWKVRVVPNKFAALQSGLSSRRERTGKFLKADGFGIAEVIVETPAHNQTIATMDLEDVYDVVLAYRSRYRDLETHPDVDLITIFRNHGPMAGTSLEHPHSQLIATPIVPPHVREQLFQARISCDTFGSCVYCDLLEEEIAQKERIIMDLDGFVVLAPYASRSPFEIRVFPKKHNSSFGNISDTEARGFAEALRETLRKIYVGLDNPDYNYVVRSATTEDKNVEHYHWHVIIIPKLTTPAGFEIGSGIYINVTPPEKAAEFLRGLA